MEEAAAVAMDYIATLDNLPAEVQHLLVEIKHKETKSQELLQEITKETSGIPCANYAEVDRLAQEKLKIAERLGLLIQRARTCLDYDLRRVLVLQGDDPSQPALVSTSRNPVQEINDTLRLAIANAAPIIPPAPVVLSAVQPPAQKSALIRLTLPPLADKLTRYCREKATVPVLPQRTRLAQQQSHRASPSRGRQAQPEPPGPDEDAEGEGEDDVEEGNGDEDEDKALYCFCQKMSYGEMVACDNTECAYQWSIKPPLPEVWYCSDCSSKGVTGSSVDNAGPERTKKRKTYLRYCHVVLRWPLF
ncbi:hypothetical protein EDB84DRAFT_1511396 [Lactarius hengduanensis]|nr:hypothetical protein EDB84DRAFT_1511396 [Lactarius hengduanensis]